MPDSQRNHDFALSLHALGLVPRVEGRTAGSKRASTPGTSPGAGRLSTGLENWAGKDSVRL